jgi:poly(3-hydroxybutyrate) depolymerase
VFMLHGTSGTGLEFFDRSGWRELADVEGFMAVFPTALRHCFYEDDETVNGIFDANERRTPTKWASGQLGDPSKMPLCTPAQVAQLPADTQAKVNHPLANDLGFFDAMVSDLGLNFAIDPKRLYVSGFSNGGQMSGRLAAERSTVFASLAAAAGPAYMPLPQAARPLSFIFTVGALDDRFTTPFGLPTLPMTDAGGSEAFKSVLVRPHTTPQRLSDTSYSFSVATLYQTPVSIYTYQTSLAQPAATNRLVVGIIGGATHQYPNGDNHPVKMAELLWTQFKTQVLP